jgi:hypothetical protein
MSSASIAWEVENSRGAPSVKGGIIIDRAHVPMLLKKIDQLMR